VEHPWLPLEPWPSGPRDWVPSCYRGLKRTQSWNGDGSSGSSTVGVLTPILLSQTQPIVILAAYFPFMCLIMRETRATVILRRKAAKYRKTQTGFTARFTARSEIEKVKFSIALRESLLRPISEFNAPYLVQH
jgi:hypothetical protein